ncbi:MAG: ribokinase [Clostridia bacterium]|nr:ribokinase [Clostridia bacterium]
MGRVLVVGSINVDYVIHTDRVPMLGETVTGRDFAMNFGGKGANQATAVVKQGCEVKMLGAVGRDYAGKLALDNLKSYGIDCDGVLSVDAPTGAAVITVCKGDNHIILDVGANAYVTPEVIAANEAAFAWADIIVMQYEIPIESVFAAAKLAKRLGKTVILNPAPVKEVSDELYSYVDWIIPNEFEAELITGIFPEDEARAREAIEALRKKGCKNAIITLGKRGSMFWDGEKIDKFGIYPVRAVDTTAAGDSFIGGFCASFCQGKSVAEAVSHAAAVSAIAVSRHGAACSIPMADEVEEFLREQK